MTLLRRLDKLASANAFEFVAAVGVGLAAYGLAKVCASSESRFLQFFHSHPYWATALTPLLFVAAAASVVLLAPEARGSGIPQVLQAIERRNIRQNLAGPLVSLRTGFVKVLSGIVGLLGGASAGREGPTVQLAASIFASAARGAKSRLGRIDPRSFLVAGAAAGVSAAFNTPLAGIAFALEEIAEASFGRFKRAVIFSVIAAGLTARGLSGNYLYFGHISLVGLPHEGLRLFVGALMLGVLGGGLGGAFAFALTHPPKAFLPSSWWLRAAVCGAACAGLCLLTDGGTAGSGYEGTKAFMNMPKLVLAPEFFLEKILATLFTYFSGMAGGIFAPCLSIGASLGAAFGQLSPLLDPKLGALLGMVAFFTGAVQVPLTAVIIIMEMTAEGGLVIPLLVAALVAHWTGRLIMPVPLYRALAFGDKKAH